MSGVPEIGGRRPLPINVVAGESYWWCACGRSKTQPFCDGSHKGSGLFPKPFTAEKDGDAWLCGCKGTKNSPFCDGSHKGLSAAV